MRQWQAAPGQVGPGRRRPG